jgi:hypothetical protein
MTFITSLGASTLWLEGGKSLRTPAEKTYFGKLRMPSVPAHIER